jgi:hypothetical protein
VPNLCVNFFSLNKALKKVFNVSNDSAIVSLYDKHIKLTFNRVINTMDGCVTEVLMKTLTDNSIDGYANQSAMKELMT